MKTLQKLRVRLFTILTLFVLGVGVIVGGLFVAIGYLIGGQSGMLIALALAVGMNLFVYWNSDKLVLAETPARRATMAIVGGPEDLKGLIVLLASEAGRHITGQAIAVDGGSSCF